MLHRALLLCALGVVVTAVWTAFVWRNRARGPARSLRTPHKPRPRLRRQTRGWEQLLPKLRKGSLVAALLCGTGLAYGAWQAHRVPERIDAWIGQPVVVQASVLTAKTVTGGRVFQIQLNQVASDAQKLHCRVQAQWAVWGASDVTQRLTAGSQITATGVLVYPPQKTSKGVPLRQDLAHAGIYYEFEGSLHAVSAPPRTWVGDTRVRLSKAVAALPYGTPAQQVLLSSVVFGGENVSPAEKQVFLKSGLLHILAASGANIMIVEGALASLLLPVWRRLRLPTSAWSLFLILFSWGFALLCGMGASIERAGVMASYRHVGHALSRRVRMLDGLALTAVVLALTVPRQVNSASSLLSLVATGALALVLERMAQRGRRRKRRHRLLRWLQALWMHLRMVLWTSLAVELALLPLTLTLFQQVTPYAVLTNIVAEPLLALLLPLAALYLGLAVIAVMVPWMTVLVIPVAYVVYPLLAGITEIANRVANWPGALLTTVPIPGAAWWMAGLYAGALVGVTQLPKARRKPRKARFWRRKVASPLCYNESGGDSEGTISGR